jgi:class 3 adenylate cyclase
VNAALSTDYTAAGLPVHLARRLARLVQPSSICLSAETTRLVEGRVQVRQTDPIAASGSDVPMAVYELLDPWTEQPAGRSSTLPVLVPTW